MTKAKTYAADSSEPDPLPFSVREPSLEARAEPRPRTLLFIPRFSLASSSRVMRALRHALADAGGYTVAVEDPSSEGGVFVDIVIFREAIFGASTSSLEGGLKDGFARTMFESVEASICMVLDGSDCYLTSNVQPLLETMLEGGTLVIGAVWRTHRPSAPSDRWSGLLLWLRGLFPQKPHRDVLSGLFVVEGGSPSATNASYFVAKSG